MNDELSRQFILSRAQLWVAGCGGEREPGGGTGVGKCGGELSSNLEYVFALCIVEVTMCFTAGNH